MWFSSCAALILILEERSYLRKGKKGKQIENRLSSSWPADGYSFHQLWVLPWIGSPCIGPDDWTLVSTKVFVDGCQHPVWRRTGEPENTLIDWCIVSLLDQNIVSSSGFCSLTYMYVHYVQKTPDDVTGKFCQNLPNEKHIKLLKSNVEKSALKLLKAH